MRTEAEPGQGGKHEQEGFALLEIGLVQKGQGFWLAYSHALLVRYGVTKGSGNNRLGRGIPPQPNRLTHAVASLAVFAWQISHA